MGAYSEANAAGEAQGEGGVALPGRPVHPRQPLVPRLPVHAAAQQQRRDVLVALSRSGGGGTGPSHTPLSGPGEFLNHSGNLGGLASLSPHPRVSQLPLRWAADRLNCTTAQKKGNSQTMIATICMCQNTQLLKPLKNTICPQIGSVRLKFIGWTRDWHNWRGWGGCTAPKSELAA